MNKLLNELSEDQGAYIWFEEKEGLKSWNSAEDNPQARDSASGLISEFSPINLPFMDSKLRAKVADLSEAYDVIFGAHDAIAYIRREEEKLAAAGEDDENRKQSSTEGLLSNVQQSSGLNLKPL